MKDPAATWEKAAYTQVKRTNGVVGRSVRTERWRYTEWNEGKAGAELYDHDKDPDEFNNLAADTHYQAVRTSLKGELEKRF